MNYRKGIHRLMLFGAVVLLSLSVTVSASAGDPSFDFNKSDPDDPSEELQNPASTKHHVPIPHAKIKDGHLKMKVRLPGQALQYSTDLGQNWQDYDPKNPPAVSGDVSARAVSSDGKSTSKVVLLKKK